MKFATALLLAGMFTGISAHADDAQAPCVDRTQQEFQHNQAADSNLVDRLTNRYSTPKSNPPPELPQDGGARPDGA